MNIYDQLKQLWARVTGLEKSNASLAPLIPKIPKDYSITETDTGLKWINGKDIYFIVWSGLTPSDTDYISLNLLYDTIIKFEGSMVVENRSRDFNKNMELTGVTLKDQLHINKNSSVTRQGVPFIVIIYYTKPDPVPETKATKAAKKKATK